MGKARCHKSGTKPTIPGAEGVEGERPSPRGRAPSPAPSVPTGPCWPSQQGERKADPLQVFEPKSAAV